MSGSGLRAVSVDEREVERGLRRASLYRLLGAGFAYPAPDRLAALTELAQGLAVGAAPALVEPLTRFAEAAREADPAALAQEYVFLFDRGPRCPPYEGAWGEAPQLAGKAALLADIAGFYTAFGLAPAASQPDMEDHIAAELEFMSALALKEAYAAGEAHAEGLEVTRRAAAAFLADHLGRWAEAFASAVREATPLPYFDALARLLEAWIQVEIGALGAEPARLSCGRRYDPVQDEEAFTCPMAQPEPTPLLPLPAPGLGPSEGPGPA